MLCYFNNAYESLSLKVQNTEKTFEKSYFYGFETKKSCVKQSLMVQLCQFSTTVKSLKVYPKLLYRDRKLNKEPLVKLVKRLPKRPRLIRDGELRLECSDFPKHLTPC